MHASHWLKLISVLHKAESLHAHPTATAADACEVREMRSSTQQMQTYTHTLLLFTVLKLLLLLHMHTQISDARRFLMQSRKIKCIHKLSWLQQVWAMEQHLLQIIYCHILFVFQGLNCLAPYLSKSVNVKMSARCFSSSSQKSLKVEAKQRSGFCHCRPQLVEQSPFFYQDNFHCIYIFNFFI